jgi:outer membrane receptor protein involved in Fe transport
MKLKFLFITLFFTVLGFAQNNATITGTVSDREMNNETLPFATVAVKGTAISATTDESGAYTLSVPAGTHVLQFDFMGYETAETTVTVAANETKTVNQTLKSTSVTLEDVVIEKTFNREKETALLLEQKNAIEIKQSIGAQEIARKGVSDVEEGLTKVTGITKVENRGLFIRGLESRYNNLLINDFAVPSNSPFNKIIPLDLFPSDIVGYMDIFKTFNPDIYGDFAGATVNIHTPQPTQSRTKISIGTGFTTKNNLNTFLIASDANDAGNYFGYPGNDRDLPGIFGSVPAGKTLTAQQSDDAFKSGFNVDETKSPLNTSFSFTHMGRTEVGKNQNSVTYMLSTNYDNKYSIRKGIDRIFIQGQDEYDNDLNRSMYRFQTTNSSLAAVNFKSKRTKLGFNALYIRTTDNVIQDQLGYTANKVQESNKIIRLNQYEQTDYFVGQLYGSYALTEDDSQNVRAGVSFSKTKFKQPDRKFLEGMKVSDTEAEFRYGGNNLLRQYLNVDGDYFISGIAEYNYKFGNTETGDKPYKLSVGYNGYTNKLESTYRFIAGGLRDAVPPYVAPINLIDEYLQRDLFANAYAFREESTSEYQVKIDQNVHAGYANFFAKLGDKIDMNVGIRAELTDRTLNYRNPGTEITGRMINKNFTNTDILPSLNAKYLLDEKSNLRLSFSKTLTRPVLIEAIPIQYVNADGTAERGNVNLENSVNYNLDLKYEVFPTAKELFAATVFAKQIDKPIERVIENSSTGSGQIISYYNSEEAQLLGVELEAIVELSRIAEALSNFTFGLNTSIMYTNAKVDKNRPNSFDTFEERKLQGASTWLLNSDLKYEFNMSENWKSNMSFVYNVYGKRIYAVGIAQMDHIYEMPFSKLDFVWINNISDKWEVKFAADNILDPTYRLEMGDESKMTITKDRTLRDFKRGVGFSLNLSYTF